MNDKEHRIEIASIYGYHTEQGLVELQVDDVKIQMDVRKAREVSTMLHGAIEAAISDELLMKFLRQNVGLSVEQCGAALLEFRELRQGSRGTVYVQ